jgi:hypothetical protein
MVIRKTVDFLSYWMKEHSLVESYGLVLSFLVWYTGDHAVRLLVECGGLEIILDALPACFAHRVSVHAVCALVSVLHRACVFGSATSPTLMPNTLEAVFAKHGGTEMLVNVEEKIRLEKKWCGDEHERLREVARDEVCLCICHLLKRCGFVSFLFFSLCVFISMF